MTYSIVARDTETGQLGVAVQSHWFAVGRLVGWARSGVGAVATQSFVEPSYGPLALELMQHGITAPNALRALLAVDEAADVRQVGIVDAAGTTAVHTGAKCLPEAGHIAGDGFTVHANIMARRTVWDAMADAYTTATGDLVERMMVALEAAERQGGDLRGRQSAAILVVAGEATGKEWEDRVIDLRVDDDPAPLTELRRLVLLWRAYGHAEQAEQLDIAGDAEGALAENLAAHELVPDHPELAFWTAVNLAREGRADEARQTIAIAFGAHDGWRELLRRGVEIGHIELNPETVEALLADAPSDRPV